jgi:hypothetical protein
MKRGSDNPVVPQALLSGSLDPTRVTAPVSVSEDTEPECMEALTRAA